MGIIPAITGKVELVYEGEQEGAAAVAEILLGSAVKTLFTEYFPKIEKLQKAKDKDEYQEIVDWFFNESGLEITDDATDREYQKQLDSIIPLKQLMQKYQPGTAKEDAYFMKEFILWGLSEYKKLSKDRFNDGYQFKDPFGSYISKL
jgi:magnesium chelatase subunit I